MVDKAINGGTVLIGDRLVPMNVGIDGEQIVQLSARPIEATEVIDARGRFVLPGAIDAHVHFRAPAHAEKEDFTSGTSAAVAGGVTTVFEMPLADIGTSTAERLRARRAFLEREAVGDFSLIAGIGGSSYQGAVEMAEAGAVAFKTFTRPAFPGRDQNFDGCLATNEVELMRVAQAVKNTGVLWSIHAENHDIVDELADGFDFDADLPEDAVVEAHLRSKNELSELDPLSRLIHIARYTGVRAHLVHVTAKRAITLIRDARAEGLDITGEASLPNLMLTEEVVLGLGRLGLFSPAIRTEEDRLALWAAATTGEIVTFASDHASYSKIDVSKGWNGSQKPEVGGIAGVEHLLPLLLTESLRLNGEFVTAARSLTEGPAKRYGIWPKKGSLLPGADADVALVSQTSNAVDETKMKSKAAWTVFNGLPLEFRVDQTLVRGKSVYENGKIMVDKGWGKYVNGPAYRG